MNEQTTEKTFEPITTQEEFDERIKSRLARERERWAKESDVADLKAQLEAKDEEISAIKRRYYEEDVKRAIVGELAGRGVTDDGRVSRVMRLTDFEAIEADPDGVPRREHVLAQVDSVAKDLPELVRPRGAGSGGSTKPVFKQETPLTREQVENMTPEEQNQPGMRERINRFLQGERG